MFLTQSFITSVSNPALGRNSRHVSPGPLLPQSIGTCITFCPFPYELCTNNRLKLQRMYLDLIAQHLCSKLCKAQQDCVSLFFKGFLTKLQSVFWHIVVEEQLFSILKVHVFLYLCCMIALLLPFHNIWPSTGACEANLIGHWTTSPKCKEAAGRAKLAFVSTMISSLQGPVAVEQQLGKVGKHQKHRLHHLLKATVLS